MQDRDERDTKGIGWGECADRILTVDELNEILEREGMIVVSVEIPEPGSRTSVPRRSLSSHFIRIGPSRRSP